MNLLSDLRKRFLNPIGQSLSQGARPVVNNAVNNFNPLVGQAVRQIPRVQTQIGRQAQRVNIPLTRNPILNFPMKQFNSQVPNVGQSLERLGQGQFANRGNKIQDIGNALAFVPAGSIGALGVRKGGAKILPNLVKLAEQEGRFGTPLRTLSPTLRGISKPQLHEVLISNRATGQMKRLNYKNLADATRALERMHPGPDEFVFPPRPITRPTAPVLSLGIDDVSKGRKEIQKGIKNAYKVFDGQRGEAIVHKMPLSLAQSTKLANETKVKKTFFDHIATKPEFQGAENKQKLFEFVKTLHIPDEIYRGSRADKLNFFRKLEDDATSLVVVGRDRVLPQNDVITSFNPPSSYVKRLKNTSEKVFSKDSGRTPLSIPSSPKGVLAPPPPAGGEISGVRKSTNIIPQNVKFDESMLKNDLMPKSQYVYKKINGGITSPLQTIKSEVSLPAPQQLSKPVNDLSAVQLSGVKPIVSQPQSQVVPKTLGQSQLPQSGVGPSDDIISNSYKYNKLDQAYTESLDRFHPISKLGKAANKNDVIQNALTGHYGAGSIAKYHLDFELAPILKGGNVDELRQAAIMQRDIELAGRNIKGSGQNIHMKITPEMKASLDKLYKYQDNLVQEYLVKTGIMTEDSFKAMKMNNQSYVPFKRVMDQVDEFLGIPTKKGMGSVGSQNVIKKIKGSERDIIDPIESIVENTYKIVGLGQRQKVARAIVSLKDDLPKGMVREFTGENIGNKPVISLFVNGKVKKYTVPREVEEAAKGLNEDQLGTLVKILSAPTRVFRASATTLNPEFMIPNVARDMQSAFVNVGLNPLKFVSGVAHYIKKDKVYQEFLKSGGMTSFTSLDRKFFKESVTELAGKGVTIKKPSDLLRILQNVSSISEQPTRIAAFQKVYNQALKSGKSVEEARSIGAYAAQEATVNFARRGSKTQSLNAVFAFLNARMQGIDRTARTLKKDPVGAGTRLGLVVMAPGMATYAWNQQFPEYYDERIVTKNDKQNNFVIMLPSEGIGGAKFVKIPKGDIGKIFNPVEAFLDYARGQDTDVRNAVDSMIKGFSPVTNVGDIIPTALRPIVENKANKNFFFDSPIVPEYQKDLQPRDQFRSFTPSVYRSIGDRVNISPARLQNLTEGYGTGWAKIGSNVAEKFISNPEYKRDMRGAAPINSAPVLRRFLGGEKYSEAEAQKKKSYEDSLVANEVRDRVKSSGMTETYNGTVYYRDNGSVKSLKTQRPMIEPQWTGQTELDKKLLSSYKSKISARQIEVSKLYENGKITMEQAESEIKRLEALKDKAISKTGTKKVSRGRKPTLPKVKAIKLKSVKPKKVSYKLPKAKRVKQYKIKYKRVKTATKKVKALT